MAVTYLAGTPSPGGLAPALRRPSTGGHVTVGLISALFTGSGPEWRRSRQEGPMRLPSGTASATALAITWCSPPRRQRGRGARPGRPRPWRRTDRCSCSRRTGCARPVSATRTAARCRDVSAAAPRRQASGGGLLTQAPPTPAPGGSARHRAWPASTARRTNVPRQRQPFRQPDGRVRRGVLQRNDRAGRRARGPRWPRSSGPAAAAGDQRPTVTSARSCPGARRHQLRRPHRRRGVHSARSGCSSTTRRASPATPRSPSGSRPGQRLRNVPEASAPRRRCGCGSWTPARTSTA